MSLGKKEACCLEFRQLELPHTTRTLVTDSQHWQCAYADANTDQSHSKLPLITPAIIHLTSLHDNTWLPSVTGKEAWALIEKR